MLLLKVGRKSSSDAVDFCFPRHFVHILDLRFKSCYLLVNLLLRLLLFAVIPFFLCRKTGLFLFVHAGNKTIAVFAELLSSGKSFPHFPDFVGFHGLSQHVHINPFDIGVLRERIVSVRVLSFRTNSPSKGLCLEREGGNLQGVLARLVKILDESVIPLRNIRIELLLFLNG